MVSGCHDSKELEVSIASTKIPGGVMDISIIDGIHQVIDHEESRQISGDNNDELTPKPNPNPPKPLSGSTTLPKKVTVEMTINYDDKLLNHFGRDFDKVNEHLDKILSIAQVRYHSPDLPFKIDIKPVEDYKHHFIEIVASGPFLEQLKRQFRPKKLMTWFGRYACSPGDQCYTGMAEIGAACRTDGQGVSINMVRDDNFLTARTFAHEFGHNLGMWWVLITGIGAKMKMNSKMKISSEKKTTSKMMMASKMKTTSKMEGNKKSEDDLRKEDDIKKED